MTSDEIEAFINSRYGELASDEIILLMDIDKNPQIDHIIFENGLWTMWDNTGREFKFHKKKLDIKTATITRQICLLTSLFDYTIIELSNSRRYCKWQVDAEKLLQKIMMN